MKEKESNIGRRVDGHVFTSFEAVPYPCYWFGEDGVFLKNAAAENLDETPVNGMPIERLLAPVLKMTDDASEYRTTMFADIMRLSGLCVMPMPDGVLATKVGAAGPPAHYISQNLRGPVANILAVLPLLSKRMQDEDYFFIEEIQQSCYALLRLVCNMESLTVLRKRAQEMRELDLAALVHSACVSAETVCAASGVRIKALLPEAQVVVKGDARLLGEALLNMIRNAMQYTRDGNEITVSLMAAGKNAVLTIEDKGLGVKEENLAHIFESYFSVDPYSDTAERPGSGLGLTLARDLANAMGGSISAESRFGEYTRIHMFLPLASGSGEVFVSEAADYLVNRYSPVYVQLSGFCRMPVE